MRVALVLAVLAAAVLMTPRLASAVPLALGDQAAMNREIAGPAAEKIGRRAQTRRYYRRHAYAPRRYDWTYYPYWRPYQYRYWQFYYPYGGPLF